MKRPRVLLLSIIYRLSDAATRAKWMHSFIHKASIDKSVSGFFDNLIDCLGIRILG